MLVSNRRRRSDLRRQRRLDGPTLPQSTKDRLAADADDIGPSCQRLRFPSEGQGPVPTNVPALLFRGRPSAIPRFVVPVVVDPLDRMSTRRARAHIGQERVEAQPARINCDATSTVSRPCGVRGHGAAMEHGSPGPVLRASRPAVCDGLLAQLLVPAPTRPRLAAPEIRGRHRVRRPAITAAQPADVRFGARRISLQHHQAAEAKARHDGKLGRHRDLLSRSRGVRPGLLTQVRGSLRCNFTTSDQIRIAGQPSLPTPPSWLYERVTGPTEPGKEPTP